MKTVTPIVRPPVVDQISFVLPWGLGPDDDLDELVAQARRKASEDIDEDIIERAHVARGRYMLSFKIRLNGGSSVLLQIGALQPDRQKGGVHVTMNPARFANGDVERFHNVMSLVLGPCYHDLIVVPQINRIDYAVDVLHARLSRMLVSYKNAQRGTVFGKRIDTKGNIEGYNFGSVTSDYMATAYNKRQERIHAGIVKIARNGLGTEPLESNAVKQLERTITRPPMIRVEIRGKKMRGRSLHELRQLPNRFARFSFFDFDAEGKTLPRLLMMALISMCRDLGMKAALEEFKHTRYARQIHAYLRSREATWWQPETLWQDACDALQKTRLFPDEAFERQD